MHDIVKALPWGIAFILLAMGKNYGIVDAKAADTMFVVLPVLALITITNRRSCLKSRGDKSAAQ